MASKYYKPCKELDTCNELIEKYWKSKQYDKCFEGHLILAEQGYPLAECQIGYLYFEGLGVEKNLEKAVYWTRRSAEHGDRDGQYNLAWFHEEAVGVERDLEQAVVYSLGELPESEMKEIKVFDSLPKELTYPQTSPKLYAEAEKLLLTL